MTLCVAGACEQGRYAVVASDGRVTYGAQAADIFAPKMQWFSGTPKDPTLDSRAIAVDWLFMLAGVLTSADLVINEIRQDLFNIPEQDPLSPINVRATLRRAFDTRIKNWCAIRHLSMFGMTMDEFRQSREQFGDKLFKQIYERMRKDASNYFTDEVMAVGWGKTSEALILYAVDAEGDSSGEKTGMLAIGSGKNAATSTLVKLGQGRSSTLQDAIYSVLAAKFSAEGRRVGKDTLAAVIYKRGADEQPPPQITIESEAIASLRGVWEKHKNSSTVPNEAREIASLIVKLTNNPDVINRGSSQINIERAQDAMRSISRRLKGRQ